MEDCHVGQVGAGQGFSLALNTIGNRMWSWGREDYGQLGIHDEVQPEAGGYEVSPKEVPFPDEEGLRFKGLHVCDFSVVAISDMDNAYSWGLNEVGTLGHNTTADVTRPRRVQLNRVEKNGSDYAVLSASGGAQQCLMVVQKRVAPTVE